MVQPTAVTVNIASVAPDAGSRRAEGVHDSASVQESTAHATSRYPVTPWSSQKLYRPFVKWALFIGLTLGSATGAGMLLGRAFGLEAGLWWLTHAQSHGIAQLFGFAGLFTMGVAFHVVPRFRNSDTAFPWPQRVTLLLTVAGVVLRMAGQSIEDMTAVSSTLLVASGVSILVAVLTFAGVIAFTLSGDVQSEARSSCGSLPGLRGRWQPRPCIWRSQCAWQRTASLSVMVRGTGRLLRQVFKGSSCASSWGSACGPSAASWGSARL